MKNTHKTAPYKNLRLFIVCEIIIEQAHEIIVLQAYDCIAFQLKNFSLL